MHKTWLSELLRGKDDGELKHELSQLHSCFTPVQIHAGSGEITSSAALVAPPPRVAPHPHFGTVKSMTHDSSTVKIARHAALVGIGVCVLVVVLCLILGKSASYIAYSAISTFAAWFAIQFIFDYAKFKIARSGR